jgi:hypothetical protein
MQSLHQIDAQGNLWLIGMETTKEIKATDEMLAKMQPYYKSSVQHRLFSTSNMASGTSHA